MWTWKLLLRSTDMEFRRRRAETIDGNEHLYKITKKTKNSL
jgi:hypothetical protein